MNFNKNYIERKINSKHWNRWVSGNRKRDDLVEQESWDGKTKNMNESSCRFYVRVEKYQLHLLKMKNYKEQEVNEEYRRMPVTL